MSQTIDLSNYLGSSANITPEVKESFIADIINLMIDRTSNQSRDVNGKLFKPYSKAYKESLAFQAFGKTDQVNLRLTGEMLDSIQETKSVGDTVTIEVTGDHNIKKAAGNTERGRDFFGVTNDELKELSKEYRPALASDLFDRKLTEESRKLLRSLGYDDEDLDDE